MEAPCQVGQLVAVLKNSVLKLMSYLSDKVILQVLRGQSSNRAAHVLVRTAED